MTGTADGSPAVEGVDNAARDGVSGNASRPQAAACCGTLVTFGVLAVVGVVVDLWSKRAAFDPAFVPGPLRPIAGGWATFQLTTSFNEGALFGVGQGLTWLFAVLSLVAIGGVFFWLLTLGGRESAWLSVALGLILAGTLGNLYDRAGCHGEVYPDGTERAGEQRYAVRDFLLFTFGKPGTPLHQRYHYPVFNFADVFLVTGAIMLVLKSFQPEPTTPASSPQTATADPPGLPPEETAW